MSEYPDLNELREILASPAFSEIRQKEIVRGWRNEVSAGWIDQLASRLYDTSDSTPGVDPKINSKTGTIHTVESMVEELRERVKLNSIEKSASYTPPFTSLQIFAEAKKKESLKLHIKQFIVDFFSSHLGFVSEPSVVYALREKYDISDLNELSEWISNSIEDVRKEYPEDDTLSDTRIMSQPVKMDHGISEEQPLFPNIRGV